MTDDQLKLLLKSKRRRRKRAFKFVIFHVSLNGDVRHASLNNSPNYDNIHPLLSINVPDFMKKRFKKLYITDYNYYYYCYYIDHPQENKRSAFASFLSQNSLPTL